MNSYSFGTIGPTPLLVQIALHILFYRSKRKANNLLFRWHASIHKTLEYLLDPKLLDPKIYLTKYQDKKIIRNQYPSNIQINNIPRKKKGKKSYSEYSQKYLGINLTKVVKDTYNKNFKTL